MKKLLIILSITIVACTAKKLPPNTAVVYWKGKKMLVTVVDTTGTEYYQPIYLK